MKKLMFVDDEPEVLSAIKRSFFSTDYEVFTSANGSDALSIMAATDISLVVSDLRMPEMDGYNFLSIVKKEYPKTIRIILSGYADERLVMKALQKNIAKVYLLKPWDNEVLLKLVEQLFNTEDLLFGSHVLSLIKNAGELPTIKASYRSILNLIDQDAEIPEIISGIELDQSIATKILHIANSAFYGLRTGSVAQAVKYLGLNTIRSLVLTTPIIDAVDSTGQASHFTGQQLEFALTTNRILNMLYHRFLYKKIDEMSNIAGLLHNIGKTLLFTIYRNKYLSVLSEAEEQGTDITVAERDAFRVTHAEAGGYLLQWWDMPFSLVESALYHQTPFDDRIVNRELVMAVHIARKYAANRLNIADHAEFFEETYEALDIDPSKFEEAMDLEFEKWKRA